MAGNPTGGCRGYATDDARAPLTNEQLLQPQRHMTQAAAWDLAELRSLTGLYR